jgi:hypothetical protein
MAGNRGYSKLGTKVTELEEAAAERLLDADILLAGGRHASALAMGLYALEMTLKVAICRRLDLHALPVEFQIHDFEGLLTLTGLSRRIQEPESSKVKNHWDFILKRYKSSHVNELRYAPSVYTTRQVRDFLHRLKDPSNGVLKWISGGS